TSNDSDADRRPGAAPSVLYPERFTEPAASGVRTAAYSFGVRAGSVVWPAAFQSALSPAVLLPESFRGGCSFGAAPRFTPGRDLSCGRAYGAVLVALQEFSVALDLSGRDIGDRTRRLRGSAENRGRC